MSRSDIISTCVSSFLSSMLQIKAWEEAETDEPMEIDEIRVDPSPFQLVERTSLHKVGVERLRQPAATAVRRC